MPEQFFFMSIGGLGVSLAGFAGLIAALDRDPSDQTVASWRIRNIVVSGLILTIAGFGTVAAHTATGQNVESTIRLISALLAIVKVLQLRHESRPGPAWPSELNRRFAIVYGSLVVAALLISVAVAGLGLFQVLFVILLLDPISIFVRTVQDVTSPTDSVVDE